MKHGPRTILLKLLTILLSGSPCQWWTRQQLTAGPIRRQSQLKKLTLLVRHRFRAISAKIAALAGTNQFQMFATVSIKKNSCPIGYKNKDQVISSRNAATVAGRRAPDPGLKQVNTIVWFFQDHKWKQRHVSVKRQAPSVKHQAPIFRKQQASSVKLSNQPVQAPSDKHPILNNKRQALSRK